VHVRQHAIIIANDLRLGCPKMNGDEHRDR
jgi:hypothetical protein